MTGGLVADVSRMGFLRLGSPTAFFPSYNVTGKDGGCQQPGWKIGTKFYVYL